MESAPTQNRRVRFDEAGAAQMDRTAVEVFAPIYPVIAEQIVQRMGITQGCCVEIGSGPGLLALALAKITCLRMILMDAAVPMHVKARRHIAASPFPHRFTLLCGDVHHMPLNDACVDLIVSRGSVFFWERLEDAFKEIGRVLAPKGRAYIGGGFGNADLRDRICEKMMSLQPDWRSFRDRNLGEDTRIKFLSALNASGVLFDTIKDESGFWMIIRKENDLEMRNL